MAWAWMSQLGLSETSSPCRSSSAVVSRWTSTPPCGSDSPTFTPSAATLRPRHRAAHRHRRYGPYPLTQSRNARIVDARLGRTTAGSPPQHSVPAHRRARVRLTTDRPLQRCTRHARSPGWTSGITPGPPNEYLITGDVAAPAPRQLTPTRTIADADSPTDPLTARPADVHTTARRAAGDEASAQHLPRRPGPPFLKLVIKPFVGV